MFYVFFILECMFLTTIYVKDNALTLSVAHWKARGRLRVRDH